MGDGRERERDDDGGSMGEFDAREGIEHGPSMDMGDWRRAENAMASLGSLFSPGMSQVSPSPARTATVVPLHVVTSSQ